MDVSLGALFSPQRSVKHSLVWGGVPRPEPLPRRRRPSLSAGLPRRSALSSAASGGGWGAGPTLPLRSLALGAWETRVVPRLINYYI